MSSKNMLNSSHTILGYSVSGQWETLPIPMHISAAVGDSERGEMQECMELGGQSYERLLRRHRR